MKIRQNLEEIPIVLFTVNVFVDMLLKYILFFSIVGYRDRFNHHDCDNDKKYNSENL